METLTTNVIMPVLGMSQDTGKIVKWLKNEGQAVIKGEPIIEIETDKSVVELESPATGVLSKITANEGDEVPVAQVIAIIVSAKEGIPAEKSPNLSRIVSIPSDRPDIQDTNPVKATPLATRIAAEHQVDLRMIKTHGGKIKQGDVLAFIQLRNQSAPSESGKARTPASPKARSLAIEQGLDISTLRGSGPNGAILYNDILASQADRLAEARIEPSSGIISKPKFEGKEILVGKAWQIMAERTAASWATTPHFFLSREVNVSRLMVWRDKLQNQSQKKITYTDLLLRLTATALGKHPRINSTLVNGNIIQMDHINIGLVIGLEDGLVVPVIPHVEELNTLQITTFREELVARARAGRLRPEDFIDGTFTISNLGMYGVDAFNAVINTPQAAILAVGRIADRVVAVNGEPKVQPTLVVSGSFDHRVVDGVMSAKFLGALADIIEEPLELLN